MNKLILAAVFMAMLSGCSGSVEEEPIEVGSVRLYVDTAPAYICDTPANVRASFILECIKNANPMSDEEPEDYIKQCEWTSNHTFCELKKKKVKQIWDGLSWNDID